MTYEMHEYANLFPRLTDGELAELRASIREHGLLTSIVLYGGKVLDGRHRYEACQQEGITPRFEQFRGNEEEALAFVIAMNATRRHLTASQRAACAVRLLPIYEAQAKERQLATLKQNQRPTTIIDVANTHIPDIGKNPVPQNFAERIEDVGEARKKAADAMGVNHAYVSEAKRLQERAPELLQRVEAGEISLQEAKREVKKQEREEKRAQMIAEAQHIEPSEVYRVITGNMTTLHEILEDDSVDLFFTDPPYHENVTDLYTDLAYLASKKLKPGGLCLAYSGQMHLPQVMAGMAEHLSYWWTFAIRHTGGHLTIWNRMVWNDWKPVLVFAKPDHDGKIKAASEWVQDFIDGGGRDKRYHDWGQDASEAGYWLEKLSAPNNLICDPFVGAGSIAVACKMLDRRFVGTEINEEIASLARVRIAKAGVGDDDS